MKKKIKEVKKYTYRELMAIDATLNGCGGIKAPVFNMFVARNRSVIAPFIKEITEASEETQEFKDYKEAVGALVRDMGVINNEQKRYVIPDEKADEYKVKAEKLDKKNKKVREGMAARLDEVEELKDTYTEETISLRKIRESKIPDSLSGNQLLVLIDLIE